MAPLARVGRLLVLIGHALEGGVPISEVRRREAPSHSLAQHSSDVVTIVQANAHIRYQSPAVQRLLGYQPGDLVGTSFVDLVHPDDAPRVLALLDYARAWPGDSPPVEARLRHRRGPWLDTHIVGRRLPDDPDMHAVVLTTHDASLQRALADLLEHQASHDSLTNLPNRGLFRDRLEQALARARRGAGAVGVLFLDLDNFKGLNDSLGHQTVDLLLVAVAERLRACLRREDTVARMGGDEFAILLEDIAGVSDAVEVAGRIGERLGGAFNLGGRLISTTASVGIALSGPGQDRPDELLRAADAAMYRAKSQGKARLAASDPGGGVPTEIPLAARIPQLDVSPIEIPPRGSGYGRSSDPRGGQ